MQTIHTEEDHEYPVRFECAECPSKSKATINQTVIVTDNYGASPVRRKLYDQQSRVQFIHKKAAQCYVKHKNAEFLVQKSSYTLQTEATFNLNELKSQ